MTCERPQPLRADDRARLLLAADERPLAERLLAWLIIEGGLTLGEAIAIRVADLSDGAVTVTSKAGMRATRRLSSAAAELALQAAEGRASDARLLAGRTGRPLSPVAAREMLLRLAHTAGVSARSVHALRADRPLVAAA